MSVLFNAVKGANLNSIHGATSLGQGLGFADPSALLANTRMM